MHDNTLTLRQKKTSVAAILYGCFSLWPILWNTWVVFKATAALDHLFPLHFLWFISAAIVMVRKHIKVSFLIAWVLFVAVSAALSINKITLAVSDLSVILCGTLFCMTSYERKYDYHRMLKILYIGGIIISITVIADNTIGIFRNELIGIYSKSSADVKQRLTHSGGLLPYPASAGCFICSGLAAYVAYTLIYNRKLKMGNRIAVILVFAIAELMIQKRGFIIDIIVALLLLRLIRIRKEDLRSVKIKRLFRRALYVIGLTAAAISLYKWIPAIHRSVDSLFARFTSNDTTLSGRTNLYELALMLFRGHTTRGIGWGRYRAYTTGILGKSGISYETHNVYLQVLTETGVIGFAVFLIAVASTLIYGIRKFKKTSVQETESQIVIQLGLFMQFFFLAYCMSGNPLYDYNFCITYFIGIMFTLIPIKDKEQQKYADRNPHVFTRFELGRSTAGLFAPEDIGGDGL